MHGIELKSGINHCKWNQKGKCCCAKITQAKTNSQWDFHSTQNCTFTVIGVYLCSCFSPELP